MPVTRPAPRRKSIDTMKEAKAVLDRNTQKITAGRATLRRIVPSRQFYVHQWLWDSCWHAMGLCCINLSRSMEEVSAFCAGQWPNGHIGHITFSPEETKYFPGPEFWGTDKMCTGGIKTSGITQPPVFGITLGCISDIIGAKSPLIDPLLHSACRYYDYLKYYRDPEDSGLATVIHPWESGLDNSPRWIDPLNNISSDEIPASVINIVNRHRSDNKFGDTRHRPEWEQYYRYMHLVQCFREMDWDYEVILKKSPFAVKDIFFTSIFCRGCEELARILDSRKETAEAEKFQGYADHAREAIARMWDEKQEVFPDFDLKTGKPISRNTAATFLPLLAGAVSDDVLPRLLSKLEDPGQFACSNPVPSTAFNDPSFEAMRYWLGPTWPVLNAFIILGLDRYSSRSKKAQELRNDLIVNTCRMIEDFGFREYYIARQKDYLDGITAGVGFSDFSWSAAVYIYLKHKFRESFQAIPPR